MKRALDLTEGIAYVVSDLHGTWDAYQRYRDHFMSLRDQGMADKLVFLGDVIHGYGSPEDDHSLNMIWDIMTLREELGSDVVHMLLGNHELPHIYTFKLSKGSQIFTARFERILGEYRPYVIDFLKSLPFLIRTPGGVMMTHAGAASTVVTPEIANQLLNLSHDDLLKEGDHLLEQAEVHDLIFETFGLNVDGYDQLAREYTAVSGPDDERYYDFLRGLIVSNLKEFDSVWDLLFTQCEIGVLDSIYRATLDLFLKHYADEKHPQRVLVTGHIKVEDGYTIIAGKQLRFASWTHAIPKESGRYLLFDVTKPVTVAEDLLSCIYRIPELPHD